MVNLLIVILIVESIALTFSLSKNLKLIQTISKNELEFQKEKANNKIKIATKKNKESIWDGWVREVIEKPRGILNWWPLIPHKDFKGGSSIIQDLKQFIKNNKYCG